MAKIENISNTRMVDTSNYLPATQLYIKNVEDYLLGKYGEINLYGWDCLIALHSNMTFSK